MKFIEMNKKLVNVAGINHILIDRLESEGYIYVFYIGGAAEYVHGSQAVEIVRRLHPSAFEGKRLKFLKNRWVIHNLVGHPLMQLLSWLGCKSLAMEVHDATVPTPKVK